MTARPGFSDTFPDIFVAGVPSENMDQVWAAVAPMLAPALDTDETLEYLEGQLRKEEAQLWVIYQSGAPIAAAVTEMVGGPDDMACNIWAAGGRGLKYWVDFIEMIEAWARKQGCKSVVIEKARSGFLRMFKDYRVTHVTLKKEL